MFVARIKCVIACGVQNSTGHKINAIKILAIIFIFRDSQGKWRGEVDQIFLLGEELSGAGDLSEMIPCF